MDGNDDLGASSPLRPALHIYDPLSMTTGVPFSDMIDLNYLLSIKCILVNIMRNLPDQNQIDAFDKFDQYIFTLKII
jgi:hypothetical protein